MTTKTEEQKEFDVLVIGAGPGGYVAAIRAAQLGFKVACVDKGVDENKALGGSCLNIGCIPSKALLQSSYLYNEAQNHFEKYGIEAKVKLNLPRMLENKSEIVKGLTDGVAFLFKKNKVARLQGTAKITSPQSVSIIEGSDKGVTIKAQKIIIATGSHSASLAGIDVDEKMIVTSTGALDFDKVPEHLVIIGGGVIGLELGSVWQRLGAKVTVIEFQNTIIPEMDGDLRKELLKILKKQGMEFQLSSKVTQATIKNKKVHLSIEPASGGQVQNLTCDKVLLSVGRLPYTQELNLEELGVNMDKRGIIQVDENFQTSVLGIYAIGDCIPGPMLAHKASEEAVVCVEKIAGQKPHMNYHTVPSVIYTHPEVASVGFTQEHLKQAEIPFKTGKFPFMANPRARTVLDTAGFVKILAHKETDEILGCHIIGPEAGTLIHELVAVMEFGGSAEDVARMCHAHPTFPEAIKEAALDVEKIAIHF